MIAHVALADVLIMGFIGTGLLLVLGFIIHATTPYDD